MAASLSETAGLVTVEEEGLILSKSFEEACPGFPLNLAPEIPS